jgi:hypothetical protein
MRLHASHIASHATCKLVVVVVVVVAATRRKLFPTTDGRQTMVWLCLATRKN